MDASPVPAPAPPPLGGGWWWAWGLLWRLAADPGEGAAFGFPHDLLVQVTQAEDVPDLHRGEVDAKRVLLHTWVLREVPNRRVGNGRTRYSSDMLEVQEVFW